MFPQQPSDKEYQYSISGGKVMPDQVDAEPDRVEAAKLLMCLACYDTHYYTPKKFDADIELIMDAMDLARKDGYAKGVVCQK